MQAGIQPRDQATPPPRDQRQAHPFPGADPPGPGMPPRNRHPPAQCMLGDMGNKWAVCIPLECILVLLSFLPLLDDNGPLTSEQK